MLVLQVFIMRNGAFEGTEMVTGDRIEIGRDPTNQLLLDDESCSRKHAVLFEHDGKIALQDLGSANGTRVNGEPVGNGRYIGARDDIAIGVFTLKVKVMTGVGVGRNAPPPPSNQADQTRVMQGPSAELVQRAMAERAQAEHRSSSSAPRPATMGQQPAPVIPSVAGVAIGAVGTERTAVGGNDISMDDGVATEAARPMIGARGVPENTLTTPSPPPVPMSEPSSPSMGRGGGRPVMAQSPLAGPDVTAPEAELPAMQMQHQRAAEAQTVPRGTQRPNLTAPTPQPQGAGLGQRTASPPPSAAMSGQLDAELAALEIPASPIGTDGEPLPAVRFDPRFLAEELYEEEEEPVWSLVQALVKPSAPEKSKEPQLEVVHYRGEHVVDHRVLTPGMTFKLGERMSRAERREAGITKVIPIVRLKAGGVAEVFQRGEVSGRLLRGNQQIDLNPNAGGAVPITDGELASLKVGNERLFLRFAGAPQLVWSRDDAAEDRFTRRLNGIAAGASFGLFAVTAIASWIYQYRNADQEIIALEDEGFADVEIKQPEMEKPPEPEPEKPPEPVPEAEPTHEKTPQPTAAKPDKTPPTTEAPKKPGVMDILNNIPKVDQSASNQNLTAALSNIKGVRVPGGAAGVKVSALIGKAPSSGVQIGGAAGGLSTSGINSLIRKDGQAGALGGKGDRAVSGKVTTLPRQIQKTGQGELSKEEIQKVIQQHIGEIQYCYEKQLNRQPGLSGRVQLEWAVNTSGRVSVVKVANSSLNSAEATNCMMSKVKTWKFPAPRGGPVTIVFPFVFNTV